MEKNARELMKERGLIYEADMDREVARFKDILHSGKETSECRHLQEMDMELWNFLSTWKEVQHEKRSRQDLHKVIALLELAAGNLKDEITDEAFVPVKGDPNWPQ